VELLLLKHCVMMSGSKRGGGGGGRTPAPKLALSAENAYNRIRCSQLRRGECWYGTSWEQPMMWMHFWNGWGNKWGIINVASSSHHRAIEEKWILKNYLSNATIFVQ
jgi:hypothetical protein